MSSAIMTQPTQSETTKTPVLLTTMQMAQFVDDGYIVLDGVMPADVCAAAIAESRGETDTANSRDFKQQQHHFPWEEALLGSAYRDVLTLPVVLGAIASLVGPEPQFDHYRLHRTFPLTKVDIGSFLGFHQDCQADMRPYTFDVNVSIYPQAVTLAMGGTMFLPGSHFRRVHNNNLYRYQHIRGSKQLTCSAGTVVLWHGNLWHSGRPNRSDSDRIMFLARLNPRQPQIRLWDTADLNQEQVAQRFLRGHAWIGGEHPIEWLNRIRLWRYLSDDPDFDFLGYAKRLRHGFAMDCQDHCYRASVVDGIPGRPLLTQ